MNFGSVPPIKNSWTIAVSLAISRNSKLPVCPAMVGASHKQKGASHNVARGYGRRPPNHGSYRGNHRGYRGRGGQRRVNNPEAEEDKVNEKAEQFEHVDAKDVYI
ncbi:hypothetical protein DPMN_084475 [Dreissena polymorpha]|uniref:Uncharacterized protein n=1 Tax=Dreissena polymorpha TaxID=45954 RepID=A0A9D3YD73_DREPO|nr:hypothetical protein DPMN_084475 [Dreissena polymorpha]